MATHTVSIRLGVDGAARVVHALRELGSDGDQALKRIAAAARPASRSLQTLSTIAADARGRLDAMASRLGLLGTAMASLGPAGLAVAAGLAVTGGGMLAASYAAKTLGGSVLDASVSLEKLMFSLNRLEGGEDKAKQVFTTLDQLAEDTQLDTDQAVNAYIQLKNIGVEPLALALPTMGKAMARLGIDTKKPINPLLILTDTMAAMGRGGDDLMEVVRQLGQAWSLNKLQMGDIRPLMERGVPVMRMLEQVTGRTGAALGELIERGQIGRDTMKALLALLGQEYGGASVAYARSFDGLMSTLESKWERFKRAIGDAGFFDAVKDALGEIVDAITAIESSGAAARIARAIGEPMAQLVHDTAAALKAWIDAQGGIEAVAQQVGGAIDEIRTSLFGVPGAAQAAGQGTQNAFTRALDTLERIGRAIGAIRQGLAFLMTWSPPALIGRGIGKLFEATPSGDRPGAPVTTTGGTGREPLDVGSGTNWLLTAPKAPLFAPAARSALPALPPTRHEVGGSIDITVRGPADVRRVQSRNTGVPLRVDQGLAWEAP